MKLFVPSNYDASKTYPLYMMLHGCLQSADDIAKSTRLNKLAEEKGFLVLYPEQTRGFMTGNPSKCWNWFRPQDQTRGGEAKQLTDMIQSVKSEYSIAGDKVYVVGFSAGGSMANILVNCYPEVFAGAAVHSGTSYLSATSMVSAFQAMRSGSQTNLDKAAQEGFVCSGSQVQKPVSTLIIHGDQDTVVTPKYLLQNLEQVVVFNDHLDDGDANGSFKVEDVKVEESESEGGYSYQYSTWTSGKNTRMGLVKVNSLGHAWSGGAPQQYSDPKGPDATGMIWRFFNGKDLIKK